jgi:formate hydrogenlyase subunit 4
VVALVISFIAYLLINTVFVFLISPLLMGLVRKMKALAQGRRGVPLLQIYYLLSKLLKKESVFSDNSSFITRVAPYLNITFTAAAALFVPLVFIPEPIYGIGNVILFLYLLVMAKFFMALAGLDAGSTFGGMGSSREMSVSAVIEPVVIIVVASVAFVLKTFNITQMFTLTLASSIFDNAALLLISISLFIVLITETSRVPVDNPETHLELTMIHEAMILEYTGTNLALMEMSHAVKQTLLMGLLINLLFPWGLVTSLAPGALLLAALMFFVKGIILSVVIGLFESLIAKWRLFSLPKLFMLAYSLALLTIVVELLV